MRVSSLKIVRRYEYDPLDRLTGIGLLAADSTQRFYQEDHLTTELGQQTQRTIFRHQAQPLAQRQSEAGVSETTLMACDQAHSLLQTVTGSNPQPFAYTAYGHHPAESGLSRLLGFNGECPDAITGHYPLGQGNRFFNPVLMRFNSPDKLGPFDERAGINPYVYCGGDPINFYDMTGNARFHIANLLRPSVIVKNPSLNKIKPTTTTIAHSSNSATKHSLLPNPAQTSPRQKNSIKDLSSFPPAKSAQGLSANKRSLSQSAQIKRQLKKDALRFDEYFKKHQPTNVEYNPHLQAKIFDMRKELIDKTAAGVPTSELHRIVSSISYKELQLKRDAIRKIEGRAGKSTINK